MPDVNVVAVIFTQYLRPRGERNSIEIEICDPDGSIVAALDAIGERGAVLECECLSIGNRGMVSLTVTDPALGDLFSELVSNEPEDVALAVRRMLIRAAKASNDDEWPIGEG